ncbi:MAG: GTPase [Bacteroidota bacterium]
MNSKKQKLIFVYNADSGKKNAVLDSLHKVFNPDTYDCNLCDITYGIIGENRTWKRFRKENQNPMEFLHRDEFQKTYASKFGYKFDFPIVLVEGEHGLEVLISAKELNSLQTPQALIQLLEERTA